MVTYLMADKINISSRDGESEAMREMRIAGTCNGATTRTRVIRDKTKYTRKQKHKRDFN